MDSYRPYVICKPSIATFTTMLKSFLVYHARIFLSIIHIVYETYQLLTLYDPHPLSLITTVTHITHKHTRSYIFYDNLNHDHCQTLLCYPRTD